MQILRIARQRLILDFIQKSPKIYKPMYKYESHDKRILRELSIERYFTEWLDEHWVIMEKMLSSQELESINKDNFREYFANVYIELLQQNSLVHEKGDINSLPLLNKLLSKKIQQIEKILFLGEKDDKRWDVIETDIEKHRAFFNRKFRKFKEA